VWIYPTAWTGNTGLNEIVTKGRRGDRGIWLLRVAKRHETANVAKLNSESVQGRHFGNSEITLNQWHHVAMRKSRRRLAFYLNGREDGAFDYQIPLDTRGPLRISGQWTVDNEKFTGLIDEVMLFNRALAADEIKILASPERWGAVQRPAGAMPPSREALVLYYPFDKAGARTEDKSGKENHGNVHKAKWTTEGKFGGAYEFDGKSAYIQRDYDARCGLFPKNTPLTLAAWFRTPAGSPREAVILATHYAGVGDGYYLGVPGHLGRRVAWSIAQYDQVTRSRRAVNDGQWHQAVAVWDGEQRSLYVDGDLQGSGRVAGPVSYLHRPPFRVGHTHNDNGERSRDEIYYFKGTIDEVMVFNRALSAAQVKALHEWKPGRQ